jgi:aspartyl-tRNA(Asn)/glutamyl-tRNA(Gln) amidotransferase subunit A
MLPRECPPGVFLALPEDDRQGIPLAVKDLFDTAGLVTTYGSPLFAEQVPATTAPAVLALERAGYAVVGKTNLDEFGYATTSENPHFGPVPNPLAGDRVAGGSSGGNAAALVLGACDLALGTDSGGSIRIPAACCGVVGFKPSYGRVSRYGLLAFASSLDQIGPFTRTVADAALALSVLAGNDPMDSTSSAEPVPDFASALSGRIDGVRVGVPRAFVSEGVDDAVRTAFDGALDTLRRSGATLVDIDLPHARYAIPVYYLVCTAEASSNLARYDGVKYGFRAPSTKDDTLKTMYSRTRDQGFGTEVKRRIILGTYVLSAGYYDAFYLKAQQVRTLLRRDYERAFERVDVVAMPTSPIPPFKLGEKTDDPLQMYLADIFTVSVNLAGLPGISIPCGFAGTLPLGFQLIGRMWDEATILRIADAYERAAPWARTAPLS